MQESTPTQQQKYDAQFSHAKTMAIQPEESSLGAAKIAFPLTHYKPHPTETMHAVEWLGKTSVQVAVKPRPTITEPKDAILKITSTAICGSDLHHYHNEFPGWHKGDILGHEFMGIIQEVGPEVKNIKKGDRVVVGFPIACGSCEYCKKGYFSACDTTNPSKAMEMQYGHRCAGAFGYSHMTGGYEGGQAEFVRVPFADIGCLKVPESLTDEQVLFLSDIAPTGWHANVCANTGPGQTVGVWGCGPVGLMAMMWARMRGVSRIIAIDNVQYRLDFAKKHYGAETINFSEEDVIKTVQKIAPGGFDASMDCAGFRFPKTLIEKVERAVMLETDQSTVLNEMIYLTKKYGSLGVVADYVGYTNHFNIGGLMEKGLRMATGQTPVQSYWKELLSYIEQGRVDPTAIITHRMDLDEAAEGYRIFDQKLENCIKVVLKPGGKTGSA